MCDLIRLDNALAQSAEGDMTTAAGMRVANDFCGVGDDVWVCLRKAGEEEGGRRGGRREVRGKKRNGPRRRKDESGL